MLPPPAGLCLGRPDLKGAVLRRFLGRCWGLLGWDCRPGSKQHLRAL